MTRGVGDCKCMAVVAEETLNSCAGVEARVVTLKNDAGNLHAVTLYTNHKGKKGFIDEINRKQYEPETAWRNIVADIGGGPWTIVEWQAFNQAGGSSPPSLSGLSAIATAVPAEPVAENPAAKANVHASATAGDLPPSLLVDIASQ
ncbi:MAG: hypothetical protein A2X34_02935 [Elusimicrobia bacterium GWC2_51_8]|nr:MAG: hypothetical protein A2X33_07620 [Elusimicrobia bacterium GWA2_51_34]OGR59574.1 MAG: hypothetical protein A2X34_02935 [Elusimicrobia bacterium GWC2_51_8]OGR85810.1 MAG: hypothetical protein A2021_00290 [Elusimicrobia bacterium GWF2_52_66]HAF95835.1 hypothetical protein [Elusimicrobiota bacterium]HCE98272.1 hypothetical protein [Elusimicrobiota bacterium]